MCLFCAIPIRAQFFVFGADKGEAPVIFTGGYRILGQASNRQGSFQEKPPDLWRMELNPTLTIYGVPITANILMSSEQSGIRQDINAFSLMLDPDAIKRIVTQRAYRMLEDFARSESGELLENYDAVRDSLAQYDPERLQQLDAVRKVQEMRDVANGDVTGYTSYLQQLGIMSDAEEFISHLPTVGVGTVFPVFSPITVSGVRLQGGSLEWNPGWFYIHLATGTTQAPLTRLDTFRLDSGLYANYDQSSFGRRLSAAKVGFGRKDGPHLFFTGVYTIDDRTSLSIVDSNTSLTPQKNMLGGLDFKVEPIEGIWSLQAEAALSLTAGDQNAPQFASKDIPQFLLDLVDGSSSTYVDWALTAATTVNVRSSGTRLSASVRRVGPGFRALGVPNLRTDIFRYDARIDQALWKRQMTVGLFMRRDRDNLIPWKRATSTITSIGATLGLNIRKWPYLRLSYAPYVQESDATNPLLQYVNRTTMITAASGYSYRIGELGAGTNINVATQNSETKGNLYDYRVTSINLSQNLSLEIPLTLGLGLGYIVQTSEQAGRNTIYTVDGSASYYFFDVVNTSGGLTVAIDDTYGTRTGFFLGVNAPLWEYAVVDLRVERNLFNERVTPPVLGGTYQENIVRLSISRSW